jgi:hypothetical protein
LSLIKPIYLSRRRRDGQQRQWIDWRAVWRAKNVPAVQRRRLYGDEDDDARWKKEGDDDKATERVTSETTNRVERRQPLELVWYLGGSWPSLNATVKDATPLGSIGSTR